MLNGLAVRMSPKAAAAVRAMPGVRAVVPDVPSRPAMYATPAQIGAPALWAQVGGQANAGRGIKVAIIDSGIYVTKAGRELRRQPVLQRRGLHDAPGIPEGRHTLHEQQGDRGARVLPPERSPHDGERHADPGPGCHPARHACQRNGGV